MIWVFAYGSNMHLPDLARWAAERGLPTPVVRCARVATLEGYALTWDYRSPTRRGGAANVRPAPGTSTPGVALQVDAPTLARSSALAPRQTTCIVGAVLLHMFSRMSRIKRSRPIVMRCWPGCEACSWALRTSRC